MIRRGFRSSVFSIAFTFTLLLAPAGDARASAAAGARDRIRGALDANAAAATPEAYQLSGHTPADVLAGLARAGTAPAELCAELGALTAEELALFEEPLAEERYQFLLPCADALRSRLRVYWQEMRANLAVQHGHRGPVTGPAWREGAPGVPTPFTLPSTEMRIDPRERPVLTDAALGPGRVAITLDDGPHPRLTDDILKTLKDTGVRATFFEVGHNAHAFPEVSRKVVAAGHTVGSHSWDHPQLNRLPEAKAEKQIRDGRNAVMEASGLDIPFFRFPYGAKNARLLQFAENEGLASFFWNMDSLDWKIRNPARLLANALAELDREQGGIILFHDVHPQTAIALPHFLEELHERGCETVVFVP